MTGIPSVASSAILPPVANSGAGKENLLPITSALEAIKTSTSAPSIQKTEKSTKLDLSKDLNSTFSCMQASQALDTDISLLELWYQYGFSILEQIDLIFNEDAQVKEKILEYNKNLIVDLPGIFYLFKYHQQADFLSLEDIHAFKSNPFFVDKPLLVKRINGIKAYLSRYTMISKEVYEHLIAKIKIEKLKKRRLENKKKVEDLLHAFSKATELCLSVLNTPDGFNHIYLSIGALSNSFLQTRRMEEYSSVLTKQFKRLVYPFEWAMQARKETGISCIRELSVEIEKDSFGKSVESILAVEDMVLRIFCENRTASYKFAALLQMLENKAFSMEMISHASSRVLASPTDADRSKPKEALAAKLVNISIMEDCLCNVFCCFRSLLEEITAKSLLERFDCSTCNLEQVHDTLDLILRESKKLRDLSLPDEEVLALFEKYTVKEEWVALLGIIQSEFLSQIEKDMQSLLKNFSIAEEQLLDSQLKGILLWKLFESGAQVFSLSLNRIKEELERRSMKFVTSLQSYFATAPSINEEEATTIKEYIEFTSEQFEQLFVGLQMLLPIVKGTIKDSLRPLDEGSLYLRDISDLKLFTTKKGISVELFTIQWEELHKCYRADIIVEPKDALAFSEAVKLPKNEDRLELISEINSESSGACEGFSESATSFRSLDDDTLSLDSRARSTLSLSKKQKRLHMKAEREKVIAEKWEKVAFLDVEVATEEAVLYWRGTKKLRQVLSRILELNIALNNKNGSGAHRRYGEKTIVSYNTRNKRKGIPIGTIKKINSTLKDELEKTRGKSN